MTDTCYQETAGSQSQRSLAVRVQGVENRNPTVKSFFFSSLSFLRFLIPYCIIPVNYSRGLFHGAYMRCAVFALPFTAGREEWRMTTELPDMSADLAIKSSFPLPS